MSVTVTDAQVDAALEAATAKLIELLPELTVEMDDFDRQAMRAAVEAALAILPPARTFEETLQDAANEISIYGDLATFFRMLQAREWTGASVEYVTDRVWPQAK